MDDISTVIKGGDYRKSLVALRDYLADRLTRPPCKECGYDGMSAADSAALTLRLTKVLEALEAVGPEPSKELSGLEAIQARRGGLAVVPDPESAVDDTAVLGTKKAPRRQGGRRPRVIREA